MALVSLRQLLDHAAENNYGVGAFNVNNLIIWGFTGGLVSALLDLAGIAQEWDRTKQHHLDFS